MRGTEARWAVVLAGGDGTRLRALTRQIAGDERPKQFCPLLGRHTLLDETRARLARRISPLRTLFVVTRRHERFYRPALADVPPLGIVVQPENRGTAPAILYALSRLAAVAPAARVAVVPSDHYVSDDEAFMRHVDRAFDGLRPGSDAVVLLGIAPDRPEVEYGWIEPDEPVGRRWTDEITPVRRFWEKPPAPLAETLQARGCLWNSFVMVGRAAAFLALVRDAAPALARAFAALAPVLGSAEERAAVQALYAELPTLDFSRDVLGVRPSRLAVLPVRDVGWNDLGDPRRVLASRRESQAAALALR